ncbi:4-hydroxy-tetrahydrodipicolinate reductase [Tenuibacillus multivorans]|uniref:4-hydroxy-tetrahydrodipicolinate reductase n=1 Tax=Tenuibacillus multivorans TaxID=237069 RepID=A0A1H0CTC1_9BACI|nr:4-hydroxy-tetrahydrodipicolinate reductase [Tenuibacillus multivorans]GEL76171.1 4-hydroxy-tetrahydrodipicolinate reductase [Tenuibacillus multivorans]SDN61123.1 4-hydroxy-tetrahydrodipicolinate reductase [Tenuibacillus multivorans]
MIETINIMLAGPRGKMGTEALSMIKETEHFNLVGCIDRKHNGNSVQDIDGLPTLDAPIYTDAEEAFDRINADVFIDLTNPDSGYNHTKLALLNHIRPVIGTSGFSEGQLDELRELSTNQQTGIVIAPNFAIGAVLMMRFSQMAAKYFPNVEIIEKHHDQKLDAPSGTAAKTAQLIKEVRGSKRQGHPNEKETLEGARGAEVDGIRIHSVRLPGFIAEQEVIFGQGGQTLTINHHSSNRQSFMSGVKFAVEQVMTIDHFVYGLENLME